MEYYTVEKKNNLGEQYIELSVFQAITNHEVSKINGIDFDGGKNYAIFNEKKLECTNVKVVQIGKIDYYWSQLNV